MDILSKLNVESGNFSVSNLDNYGNRHSFFDIVGGCVTADITSISTTNISINSEFFIGSGLSYMGAFNGSFIASSSGYGCSTISAVTGTGQIDNRYNDNKVLISDNCINAKKGPLVLFSTHDTCIKSNVLIDAPEYFDIEVGSEQSSNAITFNAIKYFPADNTYDTFVLYGRNVDENGSLVDGTEFDNGVKLIKAGYVSNFSGFGPGSISPNHGATSYTGNIVQFQLGCYGGFESQDIYTFSSAGININVDTEANGLTNFDPYDFITVNGISILDYVKVQKQKQFINVEVPASCQLVNFGNIGLTEFKMIPPMMQLTDDENNIIHANIQFKQDDACLEYGYNLMVGIEHDDVIPAGKYKLSVFGN